MQRHTGNPSSRLAQAVVNAVPFAPVIVLFVALRASAAGPRVSAAAGPRAGLLHVVLLALLLCIYLS